MLNSSRTGESFLSNRVLETIFNIFNFSDAEGKFLCAKALLKFLEGPWRSFVTGKHLEESCKFAAYCVRDSTNENVLMGFKILGIFFDIDEEISEKAFKCGGLHLIVNHCTGENFEILEARALAIFKAIVNGGRNCENFLLKDESLRNWLLPMLNIYANKPIKLFAYLSVNYLRTVRGRSNEILRNGFLDDVIQWISNSEVHNDLLNTFSMNSMNKEKLMRQILPMLTGSCKVAHTLGSFVICCEVYECSRKINGANVFTRSAKIVRALQRIVLLSIEIAKKFASSALTKMNQEVPFVIESNVSEWRSNERAEWFKVIGFSDYLRNFSQVAVEDMVNLSSTDLKEKFFMFDSLKQKEFLEEVKILMNMTSLSKASKAMSFIRKTKSMRVGCRNGKIQDSFEQETKQIEDASTKADGVKSIVAVVPVKSETPKDPNTDAEPPKQDIADPSLIMEPAFFKKKTDVFISYRRSNGSDLASLLKVHLQLKGFKIFFDVESLKAGNFGHSLIKNVQEARNFILILTPNALDRCLDDPEDKDWVKKEILTAINSNCTIIPVMKDFKTEIFQDERLPGPIKLLADLNQIEWHHDSQDGCFNKIVDFMIKPKSPISCFPIKKN